MVLIDDNWSDKAKLLDAVRNLLICLLEWVRALRGDGFNVSIETISILGLRSRATGSGTMKYSLWVLIVRSSVGFGRSFMAVFIT